MLTISLKESIFSFMRERHLWTSNKALIEPIKGIWKKEVLDWLGKIKNKKWSSVAFFSMHFIEAFVKVAFWKKIVNIILFDIFSSCVKMLHLILFYFEVKRSWRRQYYNINEDFKKTKKDYISLTLHFMLQFKLRYSNYLVRINVLVWN